MPNYGLGSGLELGLGSGSGLGLVLVLGLGLWLVFERSSRLRCESVTVYAAEMHGHINLLMRSLNCVLTPYLYHGFIWTLYCDYYETKRRNIQRRVATRSDASTSPPPWLLSDGLRSIVSTLPTTRACYHHRDERAGAGVVFSLFRSLDSKHHFCKSIASRTIFVDSKRLKVERFAGSESIRSVVSSTPTGAMRSPRASCCITSYQQPVNCV